MVLMYNAKEFIRWTSKNNDNSINFNQKSDPKKEMRLVNFIKKRINSLPMLGLLDKSNKYFNENHNKKNVITQSLRMTVYEVV